MIPVLFIYSGMFPLALWQQVAKELAASKIVLTFCEQKKVSSTSLHQTELLLAELSSTEEQYYFILAEAKNVPHRLALSNAIPVEFSTFSSTFRSVFSEMIEKLSVNNFAAAIEMLCCEAGFVCPTRELVAVRSCGLCHPDSKETFADVLEYLAWRRERGLPSGPKVALLIYYAQLVEGAVNDFFFLIRRIEESGFCPLPLFSSGVEGDSEPDWISLVRGEEMVAIVNCMAGRLLKRQEEAAIFEQLDVPIFQALRSWSQTKEEWLEDPRGLPPMSTAFSHTYPEMFGVSRPTMIACRTKKKGEGGWLRNYNPLPERVDTLCHRLRAQHQLQTTASSDKRLTIVLHNNPCKGIEATVGMAVGLDTFASLAVFLIALKNDGWDIGDAPLEGKALYDAIIARKAISEFRWTTVDEIVRKGGALHLMTEKEYLPWFNALEETAQQKVEEDWGPFPGEGMVWQQDGEKSLVITGLRYGNITIINQPKRGCYGAKCTGEVCRILHDPLLAPPHHWLATYYWIQQNSDAVLHFGTEGSLEYLPGKESGLSAGCFPEISLGSLPNFYLYMMDVVGEGLVAKRRGQAVLVDHLGPVYTTAKPDNELIELEVLLERWQRLQAGGNTGQLELLKKDLARRLLALCPGDDIDFTEKVLLARRRIAAVRRSLAPTGLHTLGRVPDQIKQQQLGASMLRRHPQKDDVAFSITFQEGLAEKLSQTPQEIHQLLRGLRGGYVTPGQGGSLLTGRLELLPTGRNFHGGDVSLLPTRTAWQRGQQQAKTLLDRYQRDEGRFPLRVVLPIWSTDAFKNDGELLCQILALLGVTPQWDSSDRVTEVKPIPLAKLGRPRIDVTIETSSVMREMVPHFCELLDAAVLAVCELPEDDAENFVAMHQRQLLAELRRDTASKLDEVEMRRLAACRIFSSVTGGNGGGVGLALDASAWQEDYELAEVHVNQQGYAWVNGKMVAAHDLFARQLAEVELACMKQSSEEYDILDSSCYATALGGVTTAAKALGAAPRLYWQEGGEEGELCGVAEELWRSTDVRLLNNSWLQAMKIHGAKGAMAVSDCVNNLYKWSATTGEVTKDLFDRVAQRYVGDEENRRWLQAENPYALEEITRRLLEAYGRKLWQADSRQLEMLRDTALELEGEMEESIGEVHEEFQGGGVEIVSAVKVERWQHVWQMPQEEK